MDKYYLRVIRIAAKSKLPDRWIHSQWYHPVDAEEAGTTFVLVEVVNPWFPAPQITTAITNTFNREYFRQRRLNSASDAFEAAVRKVNEALALRAEEGETDWIGNLHSILAVVSGPELHLVQTGQAQAYIVRKDSLNSVVTPRRLAEPPSPANTFTSLSAGSLEAGDKGVLATPDLFEYLSQENLAKALSKPVHEAGQEIVRLLQEKRIRTPHAILWDLSATPHLPRKTTEGETIYLDVPLLSGLGRIKHAARHVVVPAISSGVKATGGAASWFWGKTRTDFFPALKSTLQVAARKGKTGAATIAEKAGPKVSLTKDLAQDKIAHVAEKASLIDRSALLTKPTSLIVRLVNGVALLAYKMRLKSKLLFIAVAILAVLVLGLRITSFQKESKVRQARETAQQSLGEAQAKKEEADLALIYNEPDKAIALYVEALELSQKAQEHPDVVKAGQEVFSAAQKSLDTLTKTERIGALNPKINVPGAVKFVVVGDTIWAVDEGGKATSYLGEETKEAEILEGLGSLVGLLSIGDHQALFAVGSQALGLIRTQDSSGQILKAPEGGWPKAQAAETYGVTLYFLDTTAGQIWKYPTTKEGPAQAQAGKFFPQKEELGQAIDLAIDGSIYILLADGEVNRYFKGVKESFALAGLPKSYEKFGRPTMLSTDPAAALYIYDDGDKRIVELDKKGNYRRQFALPLDWEVKDMQVSGATGKLWVLASDNVYEIGL